MCLKLPRSGMARSDFSLVFESGEGFGGEVEVGSEFLFGDAVEEGGMLAQEAVHAPGRIQQMQGDGMGHDLAHQAHDFEFEGFLELRVLVQEGDPLVLMLFH